MAKSIQSLTKKHSRHKPTAIMDVCPKAVRNLLKQYGTPIMIHGHTHQATCHHDVTEGKALRVVLGSWDDAPHIMRYTQNHHLSIERLDTVHHAWHAVDSAQWDTTYKEDAP